VDVLRCAEDPLEARRPLRRAVLERGEDGTSPVVEDDDLEVDLLLQPAAEQRGGVVEEGQVPDDGAHRAAGAQGQAGGRGERAVDPGEAAVGDQPQRGRHRGCGEVEVTYRSEERRVGSDGRSRTTSTP